MAKPLEYNATLTERIDVTDALTIFRVTPDKMPEKRPWFVPGQYCVLGLNNAAKPELGSEVSQSSPEMPGNFRARRGAEDGFHL